MRANFIQYYWQSQNRIHGGVLLSGNKVINCWSWNFVQSFDKRVKCFYCISNWNLLSAITNSYIVCKAIEPLFNTYASPVTFQGREGYTNDWLVWMKGFQALLHPYTAVMAAGLANALIKLIVQKDHHNFAQVKDDMFETSCRCSSKKSCKKCVCVGAGKKCGTKCTCILCNNPHGHLVVSKIYKTKQ